MHLFTSVTAIATLQSSLGMFATGLQAPRQMGFLYTSISMRVGQGLHMKLSRNMAGAHLQPMPVQMLLRPI